MTSLVQGRPDGIVMAAKDPLTRVDGSRGLLMRSGLLGLPEDLGDLVDLGDQVVGNCDVE